jgi:DNA-binding NarL/FixJ family response regulator
MRSANVLIIEDDELVSRAFSRALKLAGYSVTCVASVAATRAKLGAARWDAVLLDLSLPDGSGESLLPEIATYVDSTRIAVISAHAESDTIVSLHNRVAVTLPKPVDADSLIELVRKLSRSAPSDRLEVFASKHNVTRKERELLRLALAGLDNHEAAKRLRVDQGTVRIHWMNIKKKTGLRRHQLLVSLGGAAMTF